MSSSTFGKRAARVRLGSDAKGKSAPSVADISGAAEGIVPLPIVSILLSATLVLVYGVELLVGRTGSLPSIGALVGLGGLNVTLFNEGGWWRIFTAPFLHASLLHLGSNCVALLIAGAVLERSMGRRWFAASFAIGAVGGSLASLYLDGPYVVSVGASGGIVALFAALFLKTFAEMSDEDSFGSRLVFRWRFNLLLASVLPTGAASSTHIDYSAHLGGALVGACVGALFLSTWINNEEPDNEDIATWVVVGFVCLAAIGFVLAAVHLTFR